MMHAHCMLDTWDYKHTLVICRTFCYFTARMVVWTYLIVMLYIHCYAVRTLLCCTYIVMPYVHCYAVCTLLCCTYIVMLYVHCYAVIHCYAVHTLLCCIYIAFLFNCLVTKMSLHLPFIFLVPYNSGSFNVIPVTLSLLQGMIKPREIVQDSCCSKCEDCFEGLQAGSTATPCL